MTSHLLIFQQDEAHDGDVNGVPNAGVVKQSSHLCKRESGYNQDIGYGPQYPPRPPRSMHI